MKNTLEDTPNYTIDPLADYPGAASPQSEADHAHNTEQAILAAAEEEFLAKGYAGARTTSIATKAGVSHAMLHYYFRSKEALFDKIIDSKVDTLAQSVLVAFCDTSGLDIKSRILKAVESHFDFVVDNARVPLFLINEMRSRPEFVPRFIGRVFGKVGAMMANLKRDFDAAVANGEIPPMDLFTLLIDIASLNIFSLMILDVAGPILPEDREGYLKTRREENVEVIERRLRV